MQAHVLNGAASVKQRQPEEPGTRNDPCRKIDVVTIGDEWGSTHGGMSTMNREIAINMASQRNVRVTFLIVGGSCSEEEKKEAGSKGVRLLVTEKTSEEFCKTSLDFYPKRELGRSIVVGHGKFGKDAQNIRNKCGCKLMHVMHTPYLSVGMLKTEPSAISKAEEKEAAELDRCKEADLVMAIGPLLTNEGNRSLSGTGKRVIEFTPGIIEEFKDIERATTESDDFEVLLVGRDDVYDFEVKGYDIAAKAFADHVLKSKPHIKLRFVGASEKSQGGKKILESFRDWGVNYGQFVVKQLASRMKLKEELKRVDLAIMPSKAEGFGLVGLEALSAGLPLLVNFQSGFAKALEKLTFGDSVIVKSHEPIEWAVRIEEVQRKNKATRLQEVQYLRKEYAQVYNWDRQCQEVAKEMARVIFGMAFLNVLFICAWWPISYLKRVSFSEFYLILFQPYLSQWGMGG